MTTVSIPYSVDCLLIGNGEYTTGYVHGGAAGGVVRLLARPQGQALAGALGRV